MIEEMRRELIAHSNELSEKAGNSELERLQRTITQEFTNLKLFTQLQQTVGNKAEWMDLNDT